MFNAEQILIGLQIAIAVLVLVLLYHVLFIAVDLRRILRRVDDVTKQIEEMIMKPISMADHILKWVKDYIEQDQKKSKKGKKSKSKKK